MKAGDVAAWMCQARDESTAEWIGHARKHNRYRVGLRLQRGSGGSSTGEDHFRVPADQFLRKHLHALDVARAPTIVDMDVVTFDPTQLLEPLAERCIPSLYLHIGLGECSKRTNPPHSLGLLGAGSERPSDRPAPEKCEEFAPSHCLPPKSAQVVLSAYSSTLGRAVSCNEQLLKRLADVAIGVILDRSDQSCLPIHVRFAPTATEMPRCREMT
jgi:hypothetical protein